VGVLKRHGEKAHFACGTRYLERPGAIALFTPELPLRRGEFVPDSAIASCIRSGCFSGKRQFLNESIFAGLDEQTRRRLPTGDC
jgi:hypothetical protein